MAPKRVGFLVFPGFVALDVVGPMEAFDVPRIGPTGSESKGYELIVIGQSSALQGRNRGSLFSLSMPFAALPPWIRSSFRAVWGCGIPTFAPALPPGSGSPRLA